ncbi:MAG: hypothetical protein QM726_21945 [Chitinophagaceae bacterium]
MNPSRIQSYVAVALGAGLIIVGLIQQQNRKKLLQEGIETEGEIFDVLGDVNKNKSGNPVIKFATKEQVWITEKYKINVPFAKKGSKVKLVYDAGNPKKFIVKEIL